MITNKYNYPETIMKAVLNDQYSRGDSEFSATGLIQPPRIQALTEQHKDEIETDVDDELFKLYGQLGHALLERAGNKLNNLTEKRFFGDIDGTRISAQIDSLSLESDGCLVDWKFSSVYGFKKGVEPKWEWRAQMNIQLELLRQNGLDAKKLQIWGMLRDWRPGESKKQSNYPNKLGFHDIEIEPREKTVDFIKKRIKEHREARTKLPECTTHDHWEWRRCEIYCPVNKWCEQYKQKGDIK